MVQINPETQKTRKERLATVIAIGVSALVHIFVIIGGLQFYRWVEEEEKKERLMVVRRVAESAPEAPRPSAPAPPRRQAPPEAKVKEEGPEPPKEDSGVENEGTPLESSGFEGEIPVEEPQEIKETSLSVVTDLPAASFTVGGPMQFSGAGTFWTRKGAPPGKYTATFNPVSGYKTPPIQTKELTEKGKVVFVGKYTRSVEIKVAINEVPGVSFDIIRPDGLKLGMTTPGRAFFEDLPPGNYTIRFHEVPGYLTPAPQTRALSPGGGGLDFAGSYLPGGGAPRRESEVKTAKAEAGLDRRVQVIVKSYPPTSVEEDFDYIRYPEIIIKRSNFQRGWCRVYLVLTVDGRGRISKVHIERPRAEEREQYGPLIKAVEQAVRRWSYDPVAAEVHVDARFYVE